MSVTVMNLLDISDFANTMQKVIYAKVATTLDGPLG
jgi:hypothetical protein